VLYEAVHSIPRQFSRGHLAELGALVDVGATDLAMEFTSTNILRLNSEQLKSLKQTPIWPLMLKLVPLFPRELAVLDTLVWTREQLEALAARVWQLLGSMTKPESGETSPFAALVDHLPGLTIYPVAGQGHLAYLLDPLLLATATVRCLSDY
jgi:hypothetical protein